MAASMLMERPRAWQNHIAETLAYLSAKILIDYLLQEPKYSHLKFVWRITSILKKKIQFWLASCIRWWRTHRGLEFWVHESWGSFRGGHWVWSFWGIILGGHFLGSYFCVILRSPFWGNLSYFLILCVVLMWGEFVKSWQADSTGLGGWWGERCKWYNTK